MTNTRLAELHAIFVERYGEKCKRFSYLQETDKDLYAIRLQVSSFIREMFYTGAFHSYVEYSEFLGLVNPRCIDRTLLIFTKIKN